MGLELRGTSGHRLKPDPPLQCQYCKNGIFPDNFKEAKLSPVYKKDSTHERNNYRPTCISVLPIISKPLESKACCILLLSYLCSHRLFLYSNWSAYRPHHSCDTALLNISYNWLKAMDNSNLVGKLNLAIQFSQTLVRFLNQWNNPRSCAIFPLC